MTAPTATTTECTECWRTTTLDLNAGTATIAVPSNGLRGGKHVPAHTEQVVLTTDDDYLFMWDCPCGHAESWTPHEEA